MKNRKILLLILVLLLGAAGYLYFTNSSSTLGGQYSDFAVKDTASITRIFIATQANETADLTRQDDGTWNVNGQYKARPDAVALLLETFNRIDVSAPVPESTFETVVKDLATSAVKVEIYTDGNTKPEKVYYVGQATQNHHGTYMLLEIDGKKSSIPFITYLPGFYGYLSTRFFTDENLWRDRAVFAYEPEKIASIKVEYNEDMKKSFSIYREGDEFRVINGLAEPIRFDKAAIEEYLTRYESVHYEYISDDTPEKEKDSVLSSNPIHFIRVSDVNGKERTLKTYYKPLKEETYDINTGEVLQHDLDRCYALVDDQLFVTMQFFILDELLVTAQDIENSSTVNK